MTIDEMLREIHDCGCAEPATACGCWEDDGYEWKMSGESADGVPSWTLWSPDDGDRWVVTREDGWYKQRGYAGSNADAVRLARAFDAAFAALEASLSASSFGRGAEWGKGEVTP